MLLPLGYRIEKKISGKKSGWRLHSIGYHKELLFWGTPKAIVHKRPEL